MKNMLRSSVARAISPSLLVLALVTMQSPVLADDTNAATIEAGKGIAFNKKKGNCLACHQIEGGDLAGTVGPPLIAMNVRFPDKAKLRQQIENSMLINPNSIMPPFGKHHILTESEIEKLVEFIYTL